MRGRLTRNEKSPRRRSRRSSSVATGTLSIRSKENEKGIIFKISRPKNNRNPPTMNEPLSKRLKTDKVQKEVRKELLPKDLIQKVFSYVSFEDLLLFRLVNKDWKQLAELELEERALDGIPMDISNEAWIMPYGIELLKSLHLRLTNDWDTAFESREALVKDLFDSVQPHVEEEDWEIFRNEGFRQALARNGSAARNRLFGRNGPYYSFLVYFRKDIQKTEALGNVQTTFDRWKNVFDDMPLDFEDEEDAERAPKDASKLKKMLFGLVVSASELHTAEYACSYEPFSKDYSGLLIRTSKGKCVELVLLDSEVRG